MLELWTQTELIQLITPGPREELEQAWEDTRIRRRIEHNVPLRTTPPWQRPKVMARRFRVRLEDMDKLWDHVYNRQHLSNTSSPLWSGQ